MNNTVPPVDEQRVRQDIVEIGRRFWQQGWVAANDGNISVRISDSEIICTPSGLAKGFLTPDQLLKCDIDGNKLEGYLKPSSEITMHAECYRQRPDIKAVVHAHPPTATGFAVAGQSLENCVLPEVIIVLGGVPLAEYGTPGGDEIPDSIRPYLKDYDAFLLANHGALAIGTDVYSAYYRMETLELFAKISLTARLLGAENAIPPAKVEVLYEQRKKFGVNRNASCRLRDGAERPNLIDHPLAEHPLPSAGAAAPDVQRIVEEVTRRVLETMGG